MTTEYRNIIFMKHYDLVQTVINNDQQLKYLSAFDKEDIEQDLALSMISAIDLLDFTKEQDLDAYFLHYLESALKNIKIKNSSHGVSEVSENSNVTVIHLDRKEKSGKNNVEKMLNIGRIYNCNINYVGGILA